MRQPDILLILNDDMGFSDLGCYGGEVETPNLDALAANGVRYTQFYNTARCCPSRASLLTGLHPHQAGVGDMVGSHPGIDGYEGTLKNNCVTIAEVLKGSGYKTYMSGKWHVAGTDEQHRYAWPRQRGFDRFYGTITGAGSYFTPSTLKRGNTDIENEARCDADYYYTDAISDNAVTMIRDHFEGDDAEKPFLQYVAYTAPHWPLHARDEDIAKYRGRFAEGWDTLRETRCTRLKKMGIIRDDWQLSRRDPGVVPWADAEHKEWQQRRMEVYAAQIDSMDQGIGRIVAELKRQGRLDNTVVLFLADNGGCHEDVTGWDPFVRKALGVDRDVRIGNFPCLMPGGRDGFCSYATEWANVSNTPFRMYKCWTHEGGISTPLIVHWPGGIQSKNALRHQAYQLPDIMATLLDITGSDYPVTYNGHPVLPFEGESMAPSFDSAEHERREPLFWEHEGNAAVRDGKWKLVRNYSARTSGVEGMDPLNRRGEWELYDLAVDRTELHDLAAAEPERVASMRRAYTLWAVRCGVIEPDQLARMLRDEV